MASAADYRKQSESLAGDIAYQQGRDVLDARAKLADVSSGRPAGYQQVDADRLGGLYDRIMQGGQFRYDPSKDNVFRDAAQAYQQQGTQAMRQTVAQTGALSGGYGNAWAGAAGSQQYGEYLKSMTDILPALEQNAYNADQSEQDRMMNQYELTQQRDADAYGRYRDSMADWQAERDFAAARADQAYERDYRQYSDRLQRATTFAGWQREDDAQAKAEAYDWALKLIGKGILPNPDILAQAGISDADAMELAKKYGYGKHHGRRGKKGTGTDASTGAATTTHTVGDM